MNKYEFYSTILQEDFPVKYREVIADNDSEQRKEIRELREALVRVEAERDSVQIDAMTYAEQRDIAQAQLAEAVGLLRGANATLTYQRQFGELHDSISVFLTRHAQPSEWADQLYTQGFDAGAAASKRLNAVRGAEHDQ